LNKWFKPTPHRGVNSVLCATLHAVATPPQGGLTQALGLASQVFNHGENRTFRQFIKSVELFRAAYAVAYESIGAFTSARHK